MSLHFFLPRSGAPSPESSRGNKNFVACTFSRGHGWNGQQGGGRRQSSAELFSFYVTNRWQRKSQSLFCCVFAMTSPSTGFAARSKLLLNSIPPVLEVFFCILHTFEQAIYQIQCALWPGGRHLYSTQPPRGHMIGAPRSTRPSMNKRKKLCL